MRRKPPHPAANEPATQAFGITNGTSTQTTTAPLNPWALAPLIFALLTAVRFYRRWHCRRSIRDDPADATSALIERREHP
jgi:hypothetical protein